MPLGEPAERCFLGPLKRFLDGLGVPTLSFEVSPELFDAPADFVDGWIGESGLSTTGFGFLANGFGFPGPDTVGLIVPDGAADTSGVSAGGSVSGSTEAVSVASVSGGSALTCASSPGLAGMVTRCA